MRQKKKTLIVTFSTTTQAMQMEKFCVELGISGRLIPVPREIHAGCGLSWKTEAKERENLTQALEKGGLVWESMYVLDL